VEALGTTALKDEKITYIWTCTNTWRCTGAGCFGATRKVHQKTLANCFKL